MNKSELLHWLREEYRRWKAFLDQVDEARMDRPGVNGDWSMKDIVAHLTGWNRWLVIRLQTAQRGELEPPPPWPAHVQDGDEINAWIYESNHGRPLREVMDETDQIFQQFVTVVESLPKDIRIEQHHESERVFHLLWLGDQRFPAGEFFDHFYDDHEPDVRAWLAKP